MSRDVVPLTEADADDIFEVVNDAATKYEGVIPPEADTVPYMPMDELTAELAEMDFYGWVEEATDGDGERLVGVIGVQDRSDVTLIRHLYVRSDHQREGIGTALLEAGIERAASSTILVGTWRAAEWAIDFYERNGFENCGPDEDLLETYWNVPAHQRAASVVLAYGETA